MTINLLQFRLISFFTLSPFTFIRVIPHQSVYSLLLGLFDELSSDSVHIGDALLGQRLAHGDILYLLVGVLELELDHADETSSLKLLETVADVLTSGHTSVLGVGTVSLVATVVLAESIDSDLLSHIDLIGDGCSAVVKPVTVVRGELICTGGLDVRSPLKHIIIKVRLCRGIITRKTIG